MNIRAYLVCGLLAVLSWQAAASSIDPDHKFAWTENVGWTNWRDANDSAQGVAIDETFLGGYIWAENAGWINVGDGTPVSGVHYANENGSDFGVNIDIETGSLFGLAWGENIGWINFDTASLGAQRARFDACASRFFGYAWSENIGWINLDDAEHFVGVDSFPGFAIASSDPPDGFMDARQDLSVTGTTPQGVTEIRVAFPCAAFDAETGGELTIDSFELTDTANSPPIIVSVLPVGGEPNTYEVLLSDPITPGHWTTLVAKVEASDGTPLAPDPGDRIDIGSLPGDVNLDAVSTAGDVLVLIDALNGQIILPINQTDINRSNVTEASDVLRLIDLLNGQNSTQVWLLEMLPPKP